MLVMVLLVYAILLAVMVILELVLSYRDVKHDTKSS